MDPEANLAEQLDLARSIIKRVDKLDDPSALESDAAELAQHVLDLHEWRVRGGFDPYAARSAGA
jgi:hypothetical protein